MKVRWVVRRSHQMFGSRYSSVSRRSSNVMLSASLQVGITKHTLGPAVLAPAVLVPAVLAPELRAPELPWCKAILRFRSALNVDLLRSAQPAAPGLRSGSPHSREARGRSHRAGPWSIRIGPGSGRGPATHGPARGTARSTRRRPGVSHHTNRYRLLPHRGAYPVHQLHNSLTPVERARKVAAVWR